MDSHEIDNRGSRSGFRRFDMLTIIVMIILVAVVVLLGLALLGPAIGNVFSNIVDVG